jgi:hypothetical protein
MNVKMSYMYRDAGNYKLFGSSVLTNINNVSIGDLELQIRDSLIDNSYFIPVKCNIPKLHFSENNEDLDHDWHEFITISSTKEFSDLSLDIIDFIHLSYIAHKTAFP